MGKKGEFYFFVLLSDLPLKLGLGCSDKETKIIETLLKGDCNYEQHFWFKR